MTTRVDIGPQPGRPAGRLLAPVVVVAHGVVLLFLVRVLLDPGWAHLEGKAPVARVVLYPLATALLPLWWSARSRAGEFPWLPQLLVVLICLLDLVGNRLDLYDSVVWFDDAVHGVGSALVSAAWLSSCSNRPRSRSWSSPRPSRPVCPRRSPGSCSSTPPS
jgi:hypothetical protein